MILLLLTPPDKARVTNTSPDDSDPLKCVDVNCTINAINQEFNKLNQMILLMEYFIPSYVATQITKLLDFVNINLHE